MRNDKNVAGIVSRTNFPRHIVNDVVNELCDPPMCAFKRFALRKFDFFRVIPPCLQNFWIFGFDLFQCFAVKKAVVYFQQFAGRENAFFVIIIDVFRGFYGSHARA